MPDLLYFDASALVKLVVREPESQALRQVAARSSAWVTSVAAAVEVPRAARIRGGEGTIKRAASVLDSFHVVALDENIVQLAVRVGPPLLRALDAIHVATALSLEDVVGAFFVYDRRLGAAATAAGLPVLTPT